MRVIRRATRPAGWQSDVRGLRARDRTLYLVHAPLQNLNASLGSNACTAFIKIYAVRRIPQTSFPGRFS
jgi:hypothetical protein